MMQGGTHQRRILLFVLFACALCGALLAPARPARAYSVVLRSDPPDGALLDGGARSIRLWFNHAVALPADEVQLVDSSGATLAVAAVRAEPYFPQQAGLAAQFDENYLFLCAIGASSWPSLAIIDLPALPAGAYRLSWRSIGLEDRQLSGGALTFGVEPAATAAAAPPRSLSQQIDDLLVSFAVEPNRPGDTFLTVRVADLRRPAAAPVERVSLSLTPPGGGPALQFEALDQGNGRYQAVGANLPQAGDWDVAVVVSRPGLADARYDLTWGLPERPGVRAAGLPGVGVGLMSVLVIAGATGGLYLRRRRD